MLVTIRELNETLAALQSIHKDVGLQTTLKELIAAMLLKKMQTTDLDDNTAQRFIKVAEVYRNHTKVQTRKR